MLTALVVGAITAAVVLLARPVSAPAPQHVGVVVLTPGADHLACVRDAAWSPDGHAVALLGYANSCPQPGPGTSQATGDVVVYDADSTAVRARIQPDETVLHALNANSTDAGHPIIEYTGLLWQQSGGRLAISFSAVYDAPAEQPSKGPGETVVGLLLVAPDGTQARVLSHTLAPGENASGEWDLRSGAFLDRPAALQQPALTYTWNASGGLSPVSFPGAATAAQPESPRAVGQPDGGTSFSIWQPATVVRDAAGDVIYRTSFAAWSPDGSYVIPSVGLSARFQVPGKPGVGALALLPVRDAALATALGRLSLVPEDRSNGPMLVSWSPDGRELAVQLIPAEPNADPDRTDHALIVYDCATGKPLTALAPRMVRQPLAGDTLLRWSSDGKGLMLYDAELGTVTIWSHGSLPGA